MTTMDSDYIYKELPKTKPRDDFWGQVSRSVHGKPVAQEQIDMIVKAVKEGLAFSHNDVLLDIACGNGALAAYFFADISEYYGVDHSDYLIGVAKEYFEKPPNIVFEAIDAASYIYKELNPGRFRKCLCYGSFAYFSFEDAERILKGLSERFSNIQTVYIGNLPDKERAHLFYPDGKDYSQLLEDRKSPIGIWRSRDEFVGLAHKTGWDIDFRMMPKEFFNAHYRYDVILRRPVQ